MPRVSVIVPVYNVEPFLEKCLASLAEQTLDELEVLVVNDGSPDSSQTIIDDFVARYPGRIRSFIKPNGGLSSARNHGLDHATGEYIGFVDGDDWVEPDMFEELLRKAEQTDADFVVSGYQSVDLVTGLRTYHRQGWSTDYGKSLAENPEYLIRIAPYAWGKLFRHSLITESGLRFPHGLIFEDIPFTYALMAKANKIEKVQRALYNYARSRPDSITHSYSPRNLEMLQTLALLNEFYVAQGLFDTYEDALRRVNVRHVYHRFVELPNYDGIAIKQSFVALSRAHLDRYFPKWFEHLDWLRTKGETWRLPFFRYAVLARAYALLPWRLHATLDWLAERRQATAELVRRFSGDRRVRLRYLRQLHRGLVVDKAALFECSNGTALGDSPLALARELASRGTHRVYVGARSPRQAAETLERLGIQATVVKVDSSAYTRLLATAGLLVSNAPLPPYFIKRPDQTYLNTLQGVPMRRVGRSTRFGFRELPSVQGDLIKADYLLFPNELARGRVMEGYMLSAQYGGTPLVMDLPRNEVLSDGGAGERLRTETGLVGGRLCMLVPSRSVVDQMDADSYATELEDTLAEIDSSLGEQVWLMVRPAMPLDGRIDFGRFSRVVPAPEGWDDHELLAAADCLVTDYSSVLFDFVATGREVVLLHQESAPGQLSSLLYDTVEELPFPVFHSARGVGEYLSGCGEFEPSPDHERFASESGSRISASASAAVLDVVLGKAGTSEASFSAPVVDIVFIPYLTKRGKARFEELLTSGYVRPGVVFVMSGSRYRARAAVYLHELQVKRGIEVNYRVTSDRILLSATAAVMSWASRRFGWRFATLDRVYLREARRLFGTTHVRSVEDVSGYKKFSAMARVLDEHADSKPF